jgi:hypothetical protein
MGPEGRGAEFCASSANVCDGKYSTLWSGLVSSTVGFFLYKSLDFHSQNRINSTSFPHTLPGYPTLLNNLTWTWDS